ncbi:MAG: cupin domain-containing protein [Nitrospirae bacterium]|nr:cupin domain-containing protein [Nitrospirota bacterium]
MTTVDRIKALLRLKRLPMEGGYYVETYRSPDVVKKDALPDRYQGARPLATAIYYLLTPDTCSAMHRLQTDEIFHFYSGDPVEMLQLFPDGTGKLITLGPDIVNGMHPQTIVPKGIWQGARLAPGGTFALLGTTMSPGFDVADYEPGRRDTLTRRYPEFRELINALTG